MISGEYLLAGRAGRRVADKKVSNSVMKPMQSAYCCLRTCHVPIHYPFSIFLYCSRARFSYESKFRGSSRFDCGKAERAWVS
jgi:hypothetical protein